METKRITADLVIINGTVITVDNNDTIAEAVAVWENKIVRVGTGGDMDSLIGDKTKVLNLSGKTLIPGFNDSHTHNAATGDFLHSLDLIDTAPELNPTIPELMQRIREKVKETPKGDWIGGKNYIPESIEEKRWPTREELDSVAPDNPLIIIIRGYHAHVVHSKALELAGITKDTPNP